MTTELQTPAEVRFAGAITDLHGILQTNYDALEIREVVDRVIEAMHEMPQVEQPVEHFFADGLYGRKVVNPKGCVIGTKIHKQENISHLMAGVMGVVSEEGFTILKAPQMFVTVPGTRRLIFAIEECTFSTVHPNPDNTRDLDVLEARIIASDFRELPFFDGGVL